MKDAVVPVVLFTAFLLLIGALMYFSNSEQAFGVECIRNGGSFIKGQCIQLQELCGERR